MLFGRRDELLEAFCKLPRLRLAQKKFVEVFLYLVDGEESLLVLGLLNLVNRLAIGLLLLLVDQHLLVGLLLLLLGPEGQQLEAM